MEMNRYKLTSLYLILILTILMIIDLITTLYALSVGGTELNPFLLYLSQFTTISEVVLITKALSFIVLLIIVKSIKYMQLKTIKFLFYGLVLLNLLYLIVVSSNTLQIIIYLL